jgi:hypothetical protein
MPAVGLASGSVESRKKNAVAPGSIHAKKMLNKTDDFIREQMIFSQPATYCITVDGHLDGSWSSRLCGMKITTSSHGDQGVITVLEGRLRDQAELSGVLNTLYELHIPLLGVKILPSD